MARPFGLVIFDCDGVLVDSERVAVAVDIESLAALGWEASEAEVVERFVGRSHSAMLAEIEAHIGRPIPDDWEARWEQEFHRRLRTDLRAVDGIHEALAQITIPTCVASSGGHDKMRLTLGLTGLYERFEGRIFSAHEVEHGKPAPDLFLHAARAMGCDPADCAVVEDSRWGIEAARAAGMRAFAYSGSVTPADVLRGPGTVVFDDMRQLPALLDGVAWPGT